MGLSGLASLALLAAMAALGVGILYRLAPFLDAFEQWVYGSPYCSPPHAFKSDLGARACEISSPPVSACWSSSSSPGSYCGLRGSGATRSPWIERGHGGGNGNARNDNGSSRIRAKDLVLIPYELLRIRNRYRR
jgi:hypothetical protein